MLEQIQLEYRTVRHEAILALEARSQEMLRNVKFVASSLMDKMRPQHDTKISLAEFKETFFLAAAEVRWNEWMSSPHSQITSPVCLFLR